MKRKSTSVSPDRQMDDSGVAGTSYDSSILNSNVAGKIESLHMINFMCHSNLELTLNSRVNFITGRNGSGKSAILAALTLVLGGSAALTNRGDKVSDLIKKGENSSSVTVTLLNDGPSAYKKSVYGSRIVITRNMSKAGANGYACKTEKGSVVSRKKEEVDNIVSALNLQIENPVCVLNQDVARSFLCVADSGLRFRVFMKATQLEEIKTVYMQTLELLVSTKTQLKEKQKSIREATQEIKRLQEKLEYFASLEERVNERKALENEYLWALVAEEEKKLKRLTEGKDRLVEKKEKLTEEDLDAENVLLEMEEEIKRWMAEVEEKMKTKEEKRGEVSGAQGEVRAFDKEIERVDSKIKLLTKKLGKLLEDVKGVEDHMEKNDTTEGQSQAEREAERKKIKEVQEKLSEMKRQLADSSGELTKAEEVYRNHLRKIENLKMDWEEMDQKRNRLNQTLLHTKAKGQDSHLKYGQYTQELLRAIENAAKKNQFQRKPIGPCGMHVSLSGDPKWARAAESVVESLMTTYLCDNQKDFKVLTGIMNRICRDKQPPVIISNFISSRYEVESSKVSVTGLPSVLDVLSFDNDVVFNTFVDQAQIEQILLFETDKQAASLLTNLQNVPKNLKMGLTVQSDKYYPAPDYRTYYGKSDKPIRFFGKLKTADSGEGIETELKEVNRAALEKRAELQEAREKVGKFESEVSMWRNRLRNLKQEERRTQIEFNHLKDFEETRPVAITKVVLQQELEELRKREKETSEELARCREELNNLRERKSTCAVRLKSLVSEGAEIEEELRKLNEKLERKRSACRNYQGKRSVFSKQIAEMEKNLKKMAEEIEKCERDLNGRIKDAEEVCPERVDTERSPVDVQKALQICERHLKTAKKLVGSREATLTEYKAKKEVLDEMKRKESLYEKAIHTLGKAALKKEERMKQVQSYTASMVSFHFQATLKTRGYDGCLKVDFEKKTLEVEVVPKGANIAMKDTRTLSGGERSYSTVSFILAIWKVIHMPFYFLDEFDVFMDKVNRKVIIDLLLEHAQFHSDKQFVFITPLDISDISPSDLISIFKMEDSNRMSKK